MKRLLIGSTPLIALCAALWLTPLGCATTLAAERVKLTTTQDRIRVEIDGQLFTEYLFQGHSKPILYPILGPGGALMVRNYPMKEGVEGEATDHPHQKSFWYTHGDVNGVDFWSEYPPARNPDARFGRIVHQKLLSAAGGNTARIVTENQWIAPTGQVFLTDTRNLAFGADGDARFIDFQITLRATHGDVTFGETKEGTMGIRTHPALRLRGLQKNEPGKGSAVNSEGVEGRDIWGKRAKWVAYWGPVDGKTMGVAIFDHPSNPRHPTHWHARDYGLVAANPFGGHDFDKELPKSTGEMLIKSGQSVTFRYRFVFHEGDYQQAKVADLYQTFASTPAAGE